jgi:hypothetical protein
VNPALKTENKTNPAQDIESSSSHETQHLGATATLQRTKIILPQEMKLG